MILATVPGFGASGLQTFRYVTLPTIKTALIAGTLLAFALSFDGPLDWTRFGLWLTMLLNRHGDRVLRVKGILNIADAGTPVAIHGVQRLVHPPVHMSAWPDDDRRSRLVFIVDGLDRGLIERSLGAFMGSASLSLSAA